MGKATYGTHCFTIVALVVILFGVLIVSGERASAQEADRESTTSQGQSTDQTPPTFATMRDILVAAADQHGAIVHYGLPLAQDDVDGQISSSCVPASGSLFALGSTAITCTATDQAGNQTNSVAFSIIVVDQSPPAITQPGDLFFSATDTTGAIVSFDLPIAADAVAGPIGVTCNPVAGSTFPIGTTTVTCSAQDPAGNLASVSFNVHVDPMPEEPTATAVPVEPTATSVPETPSPTVEPTPELTPTPSALALPWPPPPPANPIYGSGPIDGLAVIWGGLWFPVSQEFGHTLFSLSQPTLYQYGTGFGLDGRAHTGLDVGMARGTLLYSPVDGVIVAAGGTGGFGFYGNTLPGVGELRIETADGNQVILGHMAAISVFVGDVVEVGQFVGLSGGDNGDHLHIETRQALAGGGHVIVDPRVSFLIPSLEAYNAAPQDGSIDQSNAVEEEPVDETEPQAEAANPQSGISAGDRSPVIQSEESVPPSTSEILETLLNPPAAPMETSKRSAAEAVLGKRSG
jgi:murein DD-endopeptidase MepM/ murein hydrolase activator NlpD